jgi:hypothetical protein
MVSQSSLNLLLVDLGAQRGETTRRDLEGSQLRHAREELVQQRKSERSVYYRINMLGRCLFRKYSLVTAHANPSADHSARSTIARSTCVARRAVRQLATITTQGRTIAAPAI